MLARVMSAVLVGVEARLVEVQVDLSRNGLPGSQTVGLPGTAVRESQERVRIAIRNSGLGGPPSRITVNLAPADLPKQGSALDLPVAMAVLLAEKGQASRAGWLVAGELALDGTLRPVPGALPMALAAREAGLAGLVVPEGNASEAAAIDGLRAVGVSDLSQALDFLAGETELAPASAPPFEASEPIGSGEDLSDVKGQAAARRALEVAAAGGHNLLMVGPPGTGKTMLARRLRTILPALTIEESIEVTRIASAAGLVPPGSGLARHRPFRAPHHSITPAGLLGGGRELRPGEVSLASEGVLFLDELPQFGRLLDLLRQPIEDGEITIVRSRQRFTLPSRFLLVAGMNPCPCGYLGHARRPCLCTPLMIARYMSRISGPLWDRIDIVVTVPHVPLEDLSSAAAPETSDAIRRRVEGARAFQQLRCANGRRRSGTAGTPNARLSVSDLPEIVSLPADAGRLLRRAAAEHALSARAVHRVLRVARTLADLAAEPRIAHAHVAEALQYRPRLEPA